MSDIINRRITLLNDKVLNEIGTNAGLSSDYQASFFKPTPDLAMLLFRLKNEPKAKSEYTINLTTLRPTMNSINKTPLPGNILNMLN
jgi:hypothetical protein